MNNNKTRGISGLSILLCVLVLAGVYWFMSQSGVQQTAYTYQDFQKDLKKEKVESVEVKQNKVAPTGTLKIRLKNDDIEQHLIKCSNKRQDQNRRTGHSEYCTDTSEPATYIIAKQHTDIGDHNSGN